MLFRSDVEGGGVRYRFATITCPEEMGAHIDGTALVGLLQQLRRVNGGLRGKGIIVLLRKYTESLQSGYDLIDGPELGLRFSYIRFIYFKHLKNCVSERMREIESERERARER